MARHAPVIASELPQYLGPSSSINNNNTPRSIVDQQFESHHVIQHKLTIEDLDDDRLADTLALILTEFCAAAPESPDFPDQHDPAALFFSPFKQKSFTLNFYCRRLLQFNCCSKACFPVALLYLVRLAERCPIFELNDFNVHRLICTAVVLAAKWQDDISYSNAHYAKVGGIQTAAELNGLEQHMLRRLEFRLYVSKESYEDVENQILQIALART